MKDFLKASQGPPVSDLRPFFDETVSPYYSLPSADWALIEKDKESYFHRFPTIQYTLIGEPKEEIQSVDKVALQVDMLYSNVRQDRQHLQGTSHLAMDLHLVNGQWKLSGIRERTSR